MKKYLIFFLFSISQAQWFEGNLYLPDSFGGTCGTDMAIWNSIEDRIYLCGFNETFVRIDCETDEKVEPIRINAQETSSPQFFCWNRGNNHLYIWCSPYRAHRDSVHIVNCQTGQTVNVIELPRQHFGLGYRVKMCASPTSNKVYLFLGVANPPNYRCTTYMYVIDGNTHQITTSTVIGAGYVLHHDWYLGTIWNPVNDHIYFLFHPTLETLQLKVLDCSSDSVVTTFSFFSYDTYMIPLVLDTMRNRLYFLVDTTPAPPHRLIYELDCFTNTISGKFDIYVKYDYAKELIIDSENKKIYYDDYDYVNRTGKVYIFDLSAGRIEDSIPVPPIGFLALYPRNQELYCVGGDTLAVIDLKYRSVRRFFMPDEETDRFRPFLHQARGKLYLNFCFGEGVIVFDCNEKRIRKIIFNGTMQVNDILLNPLERKLYCLNNYNPYIFVFDSENLQALHIKQVAPRGFGTASFGFAPPHNKVYISYPRHIAVLDSRTDSVIKVIRNLVSYYAFAYNPLLDKLYTLDVGVWGRRRSYVIDCSKDSVIKVLNTTHASVGDGDIQFDSLTNKVYMTGSDGGLAIIDCVTDSVIKRDTMVGGGYIHFRAHGDRRVYAGRRRCGMYDRFTDSCLGYLPFPCRTTGYNAIDDRLYFSITSWVGPPGAQAGPQLDVTDGSGYLPPAETFNTYDSNKIYVVDCRTNSIIDTISVGSEGSKIVEMFWNGLNNKLYCALCSDVNTIVYVADCRTNQVVASFPQMTKASLYPSKILLDSSRNRLYVHTSRGSRLGMIRDNIIGIKGTEKKRGEIRVYPSVGRKFYFEAEGKEEVKIYNVLGKMVTELSFADKTKIIWEGKDKKGRGLNRGVYFITTSKSPMVKKLILL